jgi:hypothetical protein
VLLSTHVIRITFSARIASKECSPVQVSYYSFYDTVHR